MHTEDGVGAGPTTLNSLAILRMHLCAADIMISQIFNSMEPVPRLLYCSKACMHVWYCRQPLASCVGDLLLTPVHAHLPYLQVSPLYRTPP